MRIIKVDIPASKEANDGLEDIKMQRLGNLVLLAGKNGAGKTRILNKIFHTYSQKLPKSIFEAKQVQIQSLKTRVPAIEKELSNAFLNRPVKFPDHMHHKEKENTIIKEKESIFSQIKELEIELQWSFVETDELREEYSFVNYVPKVIHLTNSNLYAKNDLIQHVENLKKVGVAGAPNGALATIQVVQDRWFSATHQQSHLQQEEKENAIVNYTRLDNLISIFLGTKFGRTQDGAPTLFGLPMDICNLSSGQSILLQYCLAIYSQEALLGDSILVLDEPENHLHPSVIIEMIERILKCVPNGQVWIATHSVPLLAHFDPSLLWFVEAGKISHAGTVSEKVLHSLLGDDEEVARLQDFISLPAQYANSRYAFESLFEPSAVTTGSGDPQSYQIRTDLISCCDGGHLRVLDYGAGKGRLISNIVDLDRESKTSLIDMIDYIAYDKFDQDKDHCLTTLIRAYESGENRYFNAYHKLLEVYDKGTFDVVIMCNVLHEIDPKDWLQLFEPEGEISSLLKDDGILLLVEDHQIPIGEKAYQKGFLVLDTAQLKELFKIKESDTRFRFTDAKGDGRLKAHHIPKSCLIRIDETSRVSAIKSICGLAKRHILKIREQEKTYKNGKLHGFWTQQFANAQLNLTEFIV
ncbi:MAG TPA: AAA family ATPase [Cytophagales bacterium]|nr:AAA family ATPase [Cytophagales bacterium]